jgi:hypothetical protein
MGILSLLYKGEGWILRHKDESSIQSAEMKFLCAVKKGCTRLEHIRNEKIRQALGVKPILTQIRQIKMGRTSTKNGKTSSPKNSTGISTNGKKKPGKAKNAVEY